jgi:hypothetical protein
MESLLAPVFRWLGVAAIATGLLVAAAAPSAVLADSNATNTESVAQTRLEERGIDTSSGGGVAVAGPAVTFDHAVVTQKNVQVVAGGPDAEANATQTATNDATVNQTTAAATGDATATDGGAARSGRAVAGSLAIVHQLNVQVIACPNGTEPIEQTASNEADINQLSAAASGEATADGDGSATTGSASAVGRAMVRQRNIQVYVCGGDDGGGGSQTASNVADIGQSTVAASGDSDATDGGSADSGDTRASATAKATQSNRQTAED